MKKIAVPGMEEDDRISFPPPSKITTRNLRTKGAIISRVALTKPPELHTVKYKKPISTHKRASPMTPMALQSNPLAATGQTDTVRLRQLSNRGGF